MEMFLTILVACFPLLVLSALALMRQESPKEAPHITRLEARSAISARRFFADEHLAMPPSVPRPYLPRRVLLNQIERHVLLEVAAAETFLDLPTVETLRANSASPLLN